MPAFQTADLCDMHSDQLQILTPMLTNYGGRAQCHGPIVTLKVFEDNSLVRTTLEGTGHGRILVIDGGGSLRCALVGDQIAQLATENQWGGLIVYGCIRDAASIAQMPLSVFALNTHPLKSVKRGVGQTALPLQFGGVIFHPGHYLYADEDGIIITQQPLH